MSLGPGAISKADAAAYSSSEGDEDSGADDYAQPSADPRDDDFHDYNPRKRRRTGRNTKESAALGIFASDSEDDSRRPGQRWKAKQDLRHKNVSFVSAGKKDMRPDADDYDGDSHGSDQDDEDDTVLKTGLGASRNTYNAEDSPRDHDSEDDEDEDMGGIGLGFRAVAPGLSFTGTNGTPSKPPPGSKSRYDGTNPLGRGFVPSSAAEPVLKEEYRNETTPTGTTPKPSAFSTRGGAAGKKMTFAQKMMAKMGWKEGQGLGAEGQGRNLIIEQKLRPQGAGLGAVKEKSASERKEEKRQRKMRGEDVSDSEDEKRKRKDKQRGQKAHGVASGVTSGASTPRRPPKPKFLTVNDIQKAAPGLHIPDAFAPILDLTGRDQRLLTTSSGLLTPTAGIEGAEQTEARKLARRAQSDLGAFVEEWKSLEERKAWLDMELHQRQQEVDEIESDFGEMKMFSSVLDGISRAAADKEWDPVIAALKKVEATSSEHTTDEDLAAVAVAAVHPFLRDAVQGWQPLEDPKLGNFATDLAEIRGTLGLKKITGQNAVSRWADTVVDGTHRHHQKSSTPYESMIYKLIFPKLVTTVAQSWDVFDPAPLLSVLERWKELFPGFVHIQIIEQVVRRLNDAIANWKPRKKQHNLLHLWLFPWLEHLPAHHLDPKGTGIVADVRRKFRQLIDVWEFDRGVIPGIRQWKDVFRPSKEQDQWRPLVMHHILPSMARFLRRNFRVDPSDQEPYLAMLQGALEWTTIISTSMVAEVVAAEVFPMWHNLLHAWITSPDVNFVELGDWYMWWHDEALPAEITSHPTIMAEFEKGTDLIETALDLGDEALSTGKLPLPDGKPAQKMAKSPRAGRDSSHHSSSTSRRDKHDRHNADRPHHRQQHGEQPRQGGNGATAERPKNFRMLVENWCQENDLQFVPVRKANEQGRHYFRITARMDGKGGVLAHFTVDAANTGVSGGSGGGVLGSAGATDGGVLVVESRKSKFQLSREKLVDPNSASGGNSAEWTSLLDLLYSDA